MPADIEQSVEDEMERFVALEVEVSGHWFGKDRHVALDKGISVNAEENGRVYSEVAD